MIQLPFTTHHLSRILRSGQRVAKAPPRKILFATDLSPRSDRALDRAAQLARQWSAQLLVIHALDRASPGLSDPGFTPSTRPAQDPAVAIQHRIRRDLREEVAQLKIDVREGTPEQVILDAVAREGCDLVILGAAGSDVSGGLVLGSTVEYLVRRSPVSVLVVKTRPHGAYRHLLVGTDFTGESRLGLEVAAAAFPGSRLTLLHAFELPYRTLHPGTAISHDHAAMERSSMRQLVMEADLAPQVRARIDMRVEHGAPHLVLARYVEEQQADLTVIGAYGRSFLFHLLGGASTPRIMDAVPGDVLLVRAQRPAASPHQ